MNTSKSMAKSTALNDGEAKGLAQALLKLVEQESTADGLRAKVEKMLHGTDVLKNAPGEKFPRLHLRLSKTEMDELKSLEVLNEKMQLNTKLAEGVLPKGRPMTALEKLMYAMLWKNGDLGKERHLVAGVYNEGHDQKTGTVFYEFGGYLSGRNNFILDQHTLRCFAVATAVADDISQARQIETIERQKHEALIKGYWAFYGVQEPKGRDYLYEVDRLLFGAGKHIKTKY